MSNSISFTWGLTQLEDLGFVKAYNFMLRHYAKLGVARNEMLLLLHLASYKYDSPLGQSRPSQTTIAEEMGYVHRQSVARIVDGLEEKNMLLVTRRPGKPHIYDASPFAQKAFEEWRKDTCNENDTCNEIVTPTCNENLTSPVTKPLHEEEKEDNTKDDSTNPKKQTTEEIIADLEKHQEMAKERSGKNPRAKQVMGAMAGGEKQQLDIKSAFAEYLGLTPPWNWKSNREHYQFFRKEAEKGRHVQQFADWWFREDWRGKDDQSPSMNQVRTNWLQAFKNNKQPQKRKKVRIVNPITGEIEEATT